MVERALTKLTIDDIVEDTELNELVFRKKYVAPEPPPSNEFEIIVSVKFIQDSILSIKRCEDGTVKAYWRTNKAEGVRKLIKQLKIQSPETAEFAVISDTNPDVIQIDKNVAILKLCCSSKKYGCTTKLRFSNT